MKNLAVLMLALTACFPVGCYGNRSVGETVAASDETKQQLMVRWNSTVANNPSIFTTSSPMGWDFYWPSFYEFPHPTFKLGGTDAYREFSILLLVFLQTGDNFDFLANNGLFDLRVGYALADGSGKDAWSLRELVNSYVAAAAGTGYDCADSDTRAGLQEVAAKIAALG